MQIDFDEACAVGVEMALKRAYRMQPLGPQLLVAALGVEVRVGNPKSGDLDEKLAVAGDDGWVGSANATYARGAAGAQRDWGMATREPVIVDGLRTAFERNWSRAVALAEVIGPATTQ